MTNKKSMKSKKMAEVRSAKEIVNEFFDELHNIDGMDSETSRIIQRLWSANELGREELLAALDQARY